MKEKSQKKKLHTARVPAYGIDVMTTCGLKKQTGNFTNPDAKLCQRCINLNEANGLDVRMVWANDHWRVMADPPQLELVNKGSRSALVDRNDPEAGIVYLTHDDIEAAMGPVAMRAIWESTEVERALPVQPRPQIENVETERV